METVYRALKKRTRGIAATYPDPVFHRRYAWEFGYSTAFFNTHDLIRALKDEVFEHLSENLGHGFEHAAKVTIDAGTLILIEGGVAGLSKLCLDRLLLLVQSAGLLHDISRIEENHAAKGAEHARVLLEKRPFSADEIDHICRAIRNHEAFKETVPATSQMGALISDCLYDADKFRWGRDNFSHTLWDMLQFSKVPLQSFVDHYADGMGTLIRIRDSFRTRSGKKYGPDFIDIGLAIGEKLYRVMGTEFKLL